VGSEMCIRDRFNLEPVTFLKALIILLS